MSLDETHEHVFYGHDDPRWLVCDCGQHAVRSRTSHGQFTIRLIDPPRPAFHLPLRADVTTIDLTTSVDLTTGVDLTSSADLTSRTATACEPAEVPVSRPERLPAREPQHA
jgi:hypothetical protein